MHEKYGKTIRLAPNVLSVSLLKLHVLAYPLYVSPLTSQHFTDPRALSDIFSGKAQLLKDSHAYFKMSETGFPSSILIANNDEHTRMRRSIAPAFITSSLDQLEPHLLMSDKLVSQLAKFCSEGPQDIVEWFELTTRDFSGHFNLGQDLKNLETMRQHPRSSSQEHVLKLASIVSQLSRFGFSYALRLANLCRPQSVTKHKSKWYQKSAAYTLAAKERIKKGTTRSPSVLESMLCSQQKGTIVLSDEKIVVNIAAVFTAGSDTMYASLSSIIFWLCRFPEAKRKLHNEIHEAFQTTGHINSKSTSRLTHLNATIEEASRMFGPSSEIPGRMIPEGGRVIAGQEIPAG
jgi:cytochrome P450